MLTYLNIENYALIDSLQMPFDKGFNVLTGETGAGKSIILGALRLLLGERFDSESIRDAKKPVLIEASFDFSRADWMGSIFRDILQMELPQDEELLLKREISTTGKSRCFLQGKLINLSDLKRISSHFIDFVGQFDHQLLLNSDYQLTLLDRVAQTESLLNRYLPLYLEFQDLQKKKKKLVSEKEYHERERELLEHKIKEIESANIQEGEWEDLQELKGRLINAEKISKSFQQAYGYVYEGDQTAFDSLSSAVRELEGLCKFDEEATQLKERAEELLFGLEDLVQQMNHYQKKIPSDVDQIDEVFERIELVEEIKKKYGGSMEAIQETLEVAKEKLDTILNFDGIMEDLDDSIKVLETKMYAICEEVSKKRKAAAKKISSQIDAELQELRMKGASLKISFDKRAFYEKGCDEILLTIRTNVGEPFKPLDKIVSGGEVARLMLVFKKVISKFDPVSTIVFDEIDANIGGRLGNVVGEKIQGIARDHQVLLITHLPQIASFADVHFKIQKETVKGRTQTTCQKLASKEEILEEISEMMEGSKKSEISLKYAENLVDQK